MTHTDIYTKFMIEYDKANVTSSYPSLTEFEVATVLDKAYNALIAQKVTGNNVRRAGFEADLKAMEDLAPLIRQGSISLSQANNVAQNVYCGNLKKDHLYFIDGYLTKDNTVGSITNYSQNIVISPHEAEVLEKTIDDTILKVDISNISNEDLKNGLLFTGNVRNDRIRELSLVATDGVHSETVQITPDAKNAPTGEYTNVLNLRSTWETPLYLYITEPTGHIWQDTNISFTLYGYTINNTTIANPRPMDNIAVRNVPLQLVTHQTAKKFFITSYNMPWIKQPVCYIEGNDQEHSPVLYVVVDSYNMPTVTPALIVYIKKPNPFAKDLSSAPNTGSWSYFGYDANGSTDSAVREFAKNYEFECNDTVAEELVSLAVAFALENIESSRLNNKLNMRGLEA